MTSEPITSTGISRFSFESFVRGYHAYKEQWEPWIGEVLPLERDPTNPDDRHAVAITGNALMDCCNKAVFKKTQSVSAQYYVVAMYQVLQLPDQSAQL